MERHMASAAINLYTSGRKYRRLVICKVERRYVTWNNMNHCSLWELLLLKNPREISSVRRNDSLPRFEDDSVPKREFFIAGEPAVFLPLSFLPPLLCLLLVFIRQQSMRWPPNQSQTERCWPRQVSSREQPHKTGAIAMLVIFHYCREKMSQHIHKQHRYIDQILDWLSDTCSCDQHVVKTADNNSQRHSVYRKSIPKLSLARSLPAFAASGMAD